MCLTNEIGPYEHVILAFITSRIPDTLLETDIIIESIDPAFRLAGIRVSSTLQLHRLMTISKSMLLRELGVLSPELVRKVHERLFKLFELENSN